MSRNSQYFTSKLFNLSIISFISWDRYPILISYSDEEIKLRKYNYSVTQKRKKFIKNDISEQKPLILLLMLNKVI